LEGKKGEKKGKGGKNVYLKILHQLLSLLEKRKKKKREYTLFVPFPSALPSRKKSGSSKQREKGGKSVD